MYSILGTTIGAGDGTGALNLTWGAAGTVALYSEFTDRPFSFEDDKALSGFDMGFDADVDTGIDACLEAFIVGDDGDDGFCVGVFIFVANGGVGLGDGSTADGGDDDDGGEEDILSTGTSTLTEGESIALLPFDVSNFGGIDVFFTIDCLSSFVFSLFSSLEGAAGTGVGVVDAGVKLEVALTEDGVFVLDIVVGSSSYM